MEGLRLCLLCLTTGSGVPVYSRHRGAARQLPFSVIGSLNGVHMFGHSQDVLLSATCTENVKVLWKSFHDSISLIVISSEEDASDHYLHRLMDNVFHAMVMVIGLDELVNIKNVERLKKDLRACYPLIDSLLLASERIGDLVQCVDCVMAHDIPVLQECLDAFIRAADSDFGCLVARGRIVVATEKWWRLAAQEVMLLTWLVASLAPRSSRDYPVYLPHGSPTVPHRLLTFQLVPGVDVCVLCGPSPSLHKVETELVEVFWKPLLEPVKACLRVQLRSFPASIPLHQGILGLLLIKQDQNRLLFTVQAQPGEKPPKDGLSLPERRSVLRAFYTLAVTHYFPPERLDERTLPLLEEFQAGYSHSASECYIASSSHKCYALQAEQRQLFLLFQPTVPTFSLRSIATRTLQTFTKDAPF
ncbi:protein fuzzy homolog isoform X2 [Microcaecilia unicolor]|uniref:Protein fuzzy homolog isoform X2 n=1 Tax=Microcaecilia unicolor TaxID=1415580 RepID=A0A6P7XKU9_9AMPH|nr:protein fuzzy homolog isoform X2 [Microcaecilia unicolor]